MDQFERGDMENIQRLQIDAAIRAAERAGETWGGIAGIISAIAMAGWSENFFISLLGFEGAAVVWFALSIGFFLGGQRLGARVLKGEEARRHSHGQYDRH